MAEDIVTIVNDIGNKEGMPDGIQFYNIHELTLSNLYADEVGHDDNSYASDNNWNDKEKPEQDVGIIVNMILTKINLKILMIWVMKMNSTSVME